MIGKLLNGPSGSVLRGMSLLAVGNTAARLVGILSIPILTRIYEPDDFAQLAIFVAFTSIITPVVTLRYCAAIPLPRRDEMAINILAVATLAASVIISALTLVLLTCGTSILNSLSAQGLADWKYLILLVIIAGSMHEILNFWATRKRLYSEMAASEFLSSVSGNVTKIALGFCSNLSAGLLAGYALSKTVSATYMAYQLFTDVFSHFKHIRFRRMVRASLIYKGYPLFRLPSQLMLSLALQLPIIFFAYLYGASLTGQLSLAMTAIAIPVSLLANTAANAFFAEASRTGKNRPDLLEKQALSVLKIMSVVSLVPALVLFFFGPILFEIVFGVEWRIAGTYAGALSIFLYTQFLSVPIVRVLAVLGMEKEFLYINIQRLIVANISFLPALLLGWNAFHTMVLFSVATSAHRILVVTFVCAVLRRKRLAKVGNLQIRG